MRLDMLKGAIGLAAALLARRPPLEALNASIATDGLRVERDVPYGPGTRHRMDIWRPKNLPGRLPVVVFFYGGAWQAGRRQDYAFVAAPLARRGMVVVVPDYRLFPQVRFPTFVEDAALAVAAVLAGAARWGGDPGRIFLAGHSAGAYIAVLLGLATGFLAAAGADRAQLAGIAGLAGPYDFLPIEDEDIRAVFSAAADPRATQPVQYVDGRNPPLLLLHGEADRICYPRNSLALAARVRAAGGVAEARLLRGVGHIGMMAGFAPLLGFRSPAPAHLAGFVLGDSVPAGIGL